MAKRNGSVSDDALLQLLAVQSSILRDCCNTLTTVCGILSASIGKVKLPVADAQADLLAAVDLLQGHAAALTVDQAGAPPAT